jgi:putative phage-type endonuclease
MKKTEKLIQRTKEWHEARENRLTASNFSAAMGISTFKSRIRLWEDYLNISEKFTGNDATEWGSNNEKNAIYEYEKISGNRATETGFHVHNNYDWLGCSPDGLISNNGGLEVKCPYYSNVPHDRIPDYYMPQIQGCMEITDRDWWDYVSWTTSGIRIFRVHRSKDYWRWAFPLLKEFWDYVITGKKPKRLHRRPSFTGKIRIEDITDTPLSQRTIPPTRRAEIKPAKKELIRASTWGSKNKKKRKNEKLPDTKNNKPIEEGKTTGFSWLFWVFAISSAFWILVILLYATQ